MTTNIYMLQLANDKYYVGKTNNIDFRLTDHFDNDGSAWTKKYIPISLISLIKDCSKFDEDKYTLEYMSKYGIKNVRGGSFCELKFDENTIKFIKRMLNGSNDKCHNYSEIGHFINACPYKNDIVKISKQYMKDDPCYFKVSSYNTKFICHHYDFKNVLRHRTQSAFKLYTDPEEKRIIQRPYIEKEVFIAHSNVIINKTMNNKLIGNMKEHVIKMDIGDIIKDYLITIFDNNIKINSIESYFHRSRTKRLLQQLENEWNMESIVSKRIGKNFLVIEMILCQKMWISNVIYE
jgi:predicted GIY-YIG superfamily endonuclease